MKRLKKVYVEITNVCNLKCNFCPTTERQPKFMNIEEFNHILDSVKDFTDYIYLHIKGEPLLHPNLEQFLKLAYEKKLKVNLTTNGTLISKKRNILLSSPSLRQINISLHSLEQNDWYSNKEEYMDNILVFTNEAKEQESLIVALRLWNLGSEIVDNKIRNKYILDRLEKDLKLEYNILEEFNKKRGIEIRDRLYLNEDLEFIWPDLNNDLYEEHGFCYGLRDQLGILVDGTIIPCCLDGEGKINLGNIFKSNLEDILETERAKEIYSNFSNRIAIEELCKKCGYRDKFN